MSERDQQRVKNAIDALRRKPENKQCADCKSLSVPYINLTCGTFVCARCAGIHREFDHRVKSVSNSVFKLEDIQALGGNDLDKRTYLPYWNEQIFKLPEPGSEDNGRVRDFIRMKYVEKRFCHEQAQQEVPQVPVFAGAPGVTQQITPDMTPPAPQQIASFGMPQMGMGMKPMGMPAFSRPSGMTQQPAMSMMPQQPAMGMMQQPMAQPGMMPQVAPAAPMQHAPQMPQQVNPGMFGAPAAPMAAPAAITPAAPAMSMMPAVAPAPVQPASTMQFPGAMGAAPSAPGLPQAPSVPSMAPAAPAPAPTMPAQPVAPMFPGGVAAPAPQAVPHAEPVMPGLDLFSNAIPVPTQPPVVPAAPAQPPIIPGISPAPSHAPVTMPAAVPMVAPTVPTAPAVSAAPVVPVAPALVPAAAPAPAPKTTNFNSLLDF